MNEIKFKVRTGNWHEDGSWEYGNEYTKKTKDKDKIPSIIQKEFAKHAKHSRDKIDVEINGKLYEYTEVWDIINGNA